MRDTQELWIAVIEALDDAAIDRLAERLAPRLAERRQQCPHVAIDPWLDAQGASDHLGLTLNGVYKLTAARLIPFEQDGPGCRLWFRSSELDRWRQEGGSRAESSASTPLPQSGRAAS